MRARWGAIGLVVVLGCSGKTAESDASSSAGAAGGEIQNGAPGGTSAGGSAESAAGATAGAPNTGDTAPCTPGALPFQCVASCGQRAPETRAPLCEGGHWICPEGFQSALTCAPDSCALLYQTCCDPVLGNLTSTCGADGRIAPCAANQIPNTNRCVPASIGKNPCTSLENQPCELENQGCEDGSRTVCNCQATPTGLAWTCSVLPS